MILSVCWNRLVDEDLASKMCRLYAAVKWAMLIIYGNRHLCTFNPTTYTYHHNPSTLLRYSIQYCARVMNKLPATLEDERFTD